MLKGLVTALRTLQVFTVPGREARSFSSALYWFPLVGLLLGLLLAGLGWLGREAGWDGLGAALAVVGALVLTRGMHADGLADVADGFWGGRDRDAALRIMKDPSVGSYGALALGSMLLLKWVVLERLIAAGQFGWIVCGVILARTAQVQLAVWLPYARSGGGTARGFVEGAGPGHALLSGLAAFLLTVLLFRPAPAETLLAFAVAGLVVLSVGWLSLRKIGGITGDVLGAVSEVTEIAVWTAGALFFLLA
ncbi:adenosylcobinamide-GDP ribazoletransferase [Chlorobium sp. N1]|uniref:adenosylcobinamide-GDP ribazoletransferase n=1 Tax=Chlorobium sp. N1 TaxID=2491138 RepID=UPI00103B0D54|nr:adenosylcobinamide-GDP ribazoletransferase [Chlorobium sp. N1]TCD47453.1 adenosylcobinamide-GDP ribazoletransferase [Chlorobium sp. N1]